VIATLPGPLNFIANRPPSMYPAKIVISDEIFQGKEGFTCKTLHSSDVPLDGGFESENVVTTHVKGLVVVKPQYLDVLSLICNV